MSMLRQLRNFWILWVTTIVLVCFSNAVAEASYRVADLGILQHGGFGCTMAVNNHGVGFTQYGVLNASGQLVKGRVAINVDGLKFDLGTLGGPNSWMNGFAGINERGEAVGLAETDVPDPNGEDICGFGTHLTCSAFLWKDGHMKALPTLGGNNGQASAINDRGQIAGFAETTTEDSGCPPNRITLPVLWEKGTVQTLPTVGSDPDAQAIGINQQGEAVGYSGTCTQAIHAVLWKNNTAFALPDLGSQASSFAEAINDRNQIVGLVASANGQTFVAALWQNGKIKNLGTLGDFAALAEGINNKGQIVGSTKDDQNNWVRAFIYEDGKMIDLNTLFPAHSNLYATMANDINERGEISGMATVLSGPHKGETHAFLATPTNQSMGKSVAEVAPTPPTSSLPAKVGNPFLPRFGPGRFGR
jgi:probable HAF family extracellular repeat protein